MVKEVETSLEIDSINEVIKKIKKTYSNVFAISLIYIIIIGRD